jgi:hypothetical protein
MTPVEWAAIAASLTKLAELLGEHLPGTLLGGLAMFFYFRREKELREAAKAEKELAQERTKEAQTLTLKALTGLQEAVTTQRAFVESYDLDARMDRLESANKPQEVKRRGKTP